MTNLTQYRVEGGGSAWKRLFWIALGPHHPDIILPSSDDPELDFNYAPQYSDDDIAQGDHQTEDERLTESEDDRGADSDFKGRHSRQDVSFFVTFYSSVGLKRACCLQKPSVSPSRKSSRLQQPVKQHQPIESEEDEAANDSPHNQAAMFEPPLDSNTTRQASPSPAIPLPTSKPLFMRPDSTASSERLNTSANKETEPNDPLHLDWEEIVAGVRTNLSCLWRDIRNICDPLDDKLLNYVRSCFKSTVTSLTPISCSSHSFGQRRSPSGALLSKLLKTSTRFKSFSTRRPSLSCQALFNDVRSNLSTLVSRAYTQPSTFSRLATPAADSARMVSTQSSSPSAGFCGLSR